MTDERYHVEGAPICKRCGRSQPPCSSEEGSQTYTCVSIEKALKNQLLMLLNGEGVTVSAEVDPGDFVIIKNVAAGEERVAAPVDEIPTAEPVAEELWEPINKWLLDGEPGLSSKAMARAVTGNVSDSVWGRHPHPVDPADFRRCMLFLDAVPGARGKTELFMAMSPEWAALMGEWGNIEGLLVQELGDNWRDRDQRGSAPKTYKLMQRVLEGA